VESCESGGGEQMADHIFYFIGRYVSVQRLSEFVSEHRHSILLDVERRGQVTFSLYIVNNKEEVLNLIKTGKFSKVSENYLDKNILDIDLDIICNGSVHLYTFYSLEYEPLHLLDKLVEFVTDLYYFLKPLAVIHCAGENYCWALEDLKCFDYKTLKREGKPKIIGSFNIFSPEIVNNVGRDKFFMLKRIVYKVEELKDGGILLQINRNPVNPRACITSLMGNSA